MKVLHWVVISGNLGVVGLWVEKKFAGWRRDSVIEPVARINEFIFSQGVPCIFHLAEYQLQDSKKLAFNLRKVDPLRWDCAIIVRIELPEDCAEVLDLSFFNDHFAFLNSVDLSVKTISLQVLISTFTFSLCSSLSIMIIQHSGYLSSILHPMSRMIWIPWTPPYSRLEPLNAAIRVK